MNARRLTLFSRCVPRALRRWKITVRSCAQSGDTLAARFLTLGSSAIAKLPLAKDIDQFDFTGTPINEGLVRELATGGFVADQRNVVLIGGTGTGKTHLGIAIARALIRNGTRGRFFNSVDLVNRLETETRGETGSHGRLPHPPRLRHSR